MYISIRCVLHYETNKTRAKSNVVVEKEILYTHVSVISKELTASFLVDQNDSVSLVFDTKPFPEFKERADERKRSLYAIIKCKLVVSNEREYDDNDDVESENEAGICAE